VNNPGSTLLWVPHAWIAGRWQQQVLLDIDARGYWSSIRSDVADAPQSAERLDGHLLPGLVNAHSHAFQRSFAGMAERRESAHDDFWSWRDLMYRIANKITPPQLQAIAAQLYLELLRGGYTQVCEFHYLLNDVDGQPYTERNTMAWALADAAEEAGIGLTVLPVLYERAGFQQPVLRRDQRRFASTAQQVMQLALEIQRSGRAQLNAGLAIHSLRAAGMESIRHLTALAVELDGPIHIHVAEQPGEVNDCLNATGQRPIAFLNSSIALDARWQLVHATHAELTEIESIARTGASVVFCPSTEANLGDGVPNLIGWLNHQIGFTVGSDSQVGRHAVEELRLLEYGQRLLRQRRNISALPQQGIPATAHRLFNGALAGGSASCGVGVQGIEVGARADAVVIDDRSDGLLGIPDACKLDACMFSSHGVYPESVFVAGRRVLRRARHPQQDRIERRFERVMAELWA
jgi:formimidoylglutamate deiminase